MFTWSTGRTSYFATSSPSRRQRTSSGHGGRRRARRPGSVLGMLEGGATHVGVADRSRVESFRNDLYPGYKTGEGVAPAAGAVPGAGGSAARAGRDGVADGGVRGRRRAGSAAAKAARDGRVEQVFVCTPDKDLAQCVVGTRVVQLDRARNSLRDEAGVVEKLGCGRIDSGLPGRGRGQRRRLSGAAGMGREGRALTFSRFPHFEDVPKDWRQWRPSIRGRDELCATLFERWDEAMLYRTLATLRSDAPVIAEVDELRWKGPRPEFEGWCARIGAEGLWRRANARRLAADVS